MDTMKITIELTKLALERDTNFVIGSPSAEKLVNFMQTIKNGLDSLQESTTRT